LENVLLCREIPNTLDWEVVNNSTRLLIQLEEWIVVLSICLGRLVWGRSDADEAVEVRGVDGLDIDDGIFDISHAL
jgi:hypothetical protein